MAAYQNLEDALLGLAFVQSDRLAEAKKTLPSGKEFGIHLVEHNIITAEQLAQAYAAWYNIEYIASINEKMADPSILAKVPLAFLRDNTVIPIMYHDAVTVVMNNPTNFRPYDELSLLFGGNTQLAVSTKKTIMDAINRFYPLEGAKQMIEELEEEKSIDIEGVGLETIEETDILGSAQEAPIIKLVNHILFQAVKNDASDIHIEPFEKEVRVRYRIDGVLHDVMTPPKRIQGALISRIKIMANLNIAEKRQPQDGRINIKIGDKAIDIRVSILPVAFGERVVMRLLDKSKTFGKLKDLGFSEHDFKTIEDAIEQPNGIILVSGPTGSGKTSTLYSILSALNKPDVNIITVEDPVEYQLMGVSQVQVRAKIGLTFANALRSILRQDPDIIMIGETRDEETAQIAIQAALTGHLVLSTIHTNSAPATITRLIDMNIEPFLIASTIYIIIAQRLVRRLCPKCKTPYTPTQEALASIGLKPDQVKGITFYKPVGCEECNNTGYKGRLAIFEIMKMTPAIAKLTMERADTSLLRAQAIKDGMTLLVEDGITKIKAGLTTIEEVLSAATVQDVVNEEIPPVEKPEKAE